MNETISTITHKTILFSPLNWGLGHVSRSVPLIQQLINQGNELIICCNTDQEEFYRDYFPFLWFVDHQGYPFDFKGRGEFVKDMLFNYRKLKRRRDKEILEVKELVKVFTPDLIISDQRFGFRHRQVKSIIISHQLTLKLPFYAQIGQLMNKVLLKKFDEVWVPDGKENLSGELSQSKIEHKRVGLMSRFDNKLEELPYKYKYLAVVSGPMPYAKLFLENLCQRLEKVEGKHAVVASLELFDYKTQKDNVEVYYQPDKEGLERLFAEAEVVISRSGYSTLMDLTRLKKKALLIPTKGQTEQEYLAVHNANRKDFEFLSEEDFTNYPL